MDAIALADAVRARCLAAARAAYEDAGIQGLCAEGRWEAALGAVERLDLRALVAEAELRSGSAPGSSPAAPESGEDYPPLHLLR